MMPDAILRNRSNETYAVPAWKTRESIVPFDHRTEMFPLVTSSAISSDFPKELHLFLSFRALIMLIEARSLCLGSGRKVEPIKGDIWVLEETT